MLSGFSSIKRNSFRTICEYFPHYSFFIHSNHFFLEFFLDHQRHLSKINYHRCAISRIVLIICVCVCMINRCNWDEINRRSLFCMHLIFISRPLANRQREMLEQIFLSFTRLDRSKLKSIYSDVIDHLPD